VNSKKTSKPATSKGEPKTMAELLASFAGPTHGFAKGQKINGKVLAKSSKSLVLDIGGKSEGLVTERAFAEARDYVKTLSVGDEVHASVLIPENSEGYVILSLREATQGATWDRLRISKEKDTPISVLGRGAGPSGLTVEVEGLIGFIPFSQLGRDVSENPQALIGKTFKAKVIELEKSSNKVVLSEKAVSEEGEMKLAKEALSKVKEGEIYDGVVTTVANFGCFVRIEIKEGKSTIPVEGLVHISELSWSKVDSVGDKVSVGEKVKVKVIGAHDNKLSFSIKSAKKDPWEGIDKKWTSESKVTGTVTKVTDFGVFVEVEAGVEGLIHITNIPPGKKLSQGEKVDCYVQEVDVRTKKLSLGLVLTEKPIGYK